jgi:phospholipid/cholesterol/gamma-HCH transport system substrate-binding protein
MSSREGTGRIRRTFERVRNEPGLGRNVAVLLVLIVAATAVGSVILSRQRFSLPWDNKFSFYAVFPGAPGVSPGHGQEVRIAGVPVGLIDDASVDSGGHARLKLTIDPKYPVYDNATVVLRPKSPLNEMYVELSPGGPPGHRLHSGGTLAITNAKAPVQVDEALSHLDGNARSALTALLSQADTALANADADLPSGLTATDLLAKRMQPVMTALDKRRSNLRALVTALQEIATAVGGDDSRLSDLASSLQKTLDTLGNGSSSLGSSLAKLPDVLTTLKQATDSVQVLSTQLDPTLDNLRNASGKLPGALRDVTSTLDQAKTTVTDLQPVVQQGLPVVADLRPLVSDLLQAAPSLRTIALQLDPVTSMLVSYEPDVAAFFLNTRSVMSVADANGGILRGMLEVAPGMVPSDLSSSLTKKH